MAARFGKTRLVEALWARADEIGKKYGFNSMSGTAQLRPASNQEAKDRAVAYGQWLELRCLAGWIEEGQFPK